MAGKRIQGIIIEIGGDTSKLGEALSKVEKESKDIAAELRSVERLLKLDPSNVELLTQKKKLMADAVKASTERLETLKKAQRDAEQAFREGKIGEDQYRAVAREVMAAEGELKKLEMRLIDVNNRWKQAGEGISSFGAGTEALGAKLAPVSAAATAALTGIVGLAVKAGMAADDLNTLAKQTGLSTETLQRFQYASGLIDVSLETLTGSLTKLTRTMGQAQEGNKQAEEAFAQLGVVITDETGKLRDNEAVFHDVIAALGGMENETERNVLTMALMGKSAQDLNPLILGGAEALKSLGDEAAAAGLILSQEALDGANAFNDELDKTKARLTATGAAVGETFGKVLLPMVQDLAKKVQELATWFRGLDEDTARTIITVLALVAGLAPLLIIVGKVISAIGAVTTAIGALTAAAALAKVSVGAFIAIKALLLAKVVAVIAIIAALVAGIVWLIRNFDNIKEATNELKDTVATKFTELKNAAVQQMRDLWEGIRQVFASFRGFMSGLLNTHILAPFRELNLFGIGQSIIRGLIDGINSMIRAVSDSVRNVASGAVNAVRNLLGIRSPSKVFAELGVNVGEGFAEGIKSTKRMLNRAAVDIGHTAISGTAGAVQQPGASVPQNITNNITFADMMRGAVFHIREEADIDRVAQKLYEKQQSKLRPLGVEQ